MSKVIPMDVSAPKQPGLWEPVLAVTALMAAVAWLLHHFGRVACAALACLCLAGCGTAGKVYLVQWDSRDAEQIRASAVETQAFYGDVEAAKPEARSFTAWSQLFDMIVKLRVRLTAVGVEWRADK